MSLMDKIKAQIQALIGVANEKTGNADTDLTTAVNALVEGYGQGGEEVFFTSLGVGYLRNMELDIKESKNGCYEYADKMESISLPNFSPIAGGGGTSSLCHGCTALKKAYLPKYTWVSHYMFRGCTALEEAQIGSVGYPVINASVYVFYQCPQENLTITIYVDAETLADITTSVIGNSPFGATNATIIYRNSATGEVITE